MILMTQKIGDGPVRRCDQRCYGATHGKCACICGGRNHGAGIQKALANVREMFAPLVLCIHNKIVGTCEKGCSVPAGRANQPPVATRVGEVHVTNKALREMRRQEIAS